MKKLLTKKNLFYLILTVVIYALVIVLTEGKILPRKYQGILVPICTNVMLAVSLNLVVGLLGELTLGHAGFMAVGAYTGCILMKNIAGLPPVLALIVGILAGGLAAAAIGLLVVLPVLRLRGDYVAIVTLAFGQIIVTVLTNFDDIFHKEITGGASGLKDIPGHASFTFVYIVMVLTVLLLSTLANSRHGRAIMSIRENEVAARSVGINVTYYKMLAFVIAAFFAGIAGVLYGSDLGLLKPNDFDYNRSIEILVFVVLGGMGSIKGSIIAAVLLTILPQALRGFSDFQMLAYSLVLIAMMLLNASPRFADLKAKLTWRNLWSLFGKKKAAAK